MSVLRTNGPLVILLWGRKVSASNQYWGHTSLGLGLLYWGHTSLGLGLGRWHYENMPMQYTEIFKVVKK